MNINYIKDNLAYLYIIFIEILPINIFMFGLVNMIMMINMVIG